MNRSDLDRRSRGNSRHALGRGAWLAGLFVAAWTGAAQAQLIGSGGTVGTTTGGTLATSDFFIGVQKVEGVNLSDVDKSRFLNHASCQCKRDVWIKAILVNATSAAKAQLLPGTDIVTMMIGQGCNNALYYHACLTLDSVPLSQFRLTGMQVHTTVDKLAGTYGTGTTILSGSGGVVGSTDDTGSGGSVGSDGSGGNTGSDPCAVGDAYSQPVWIFVESTPTLYDAGSAQLNVVIDGNAPPAPSPVTVTGANEALVVDWTSMNADNAVTDIQGYQVFCSRADQYQVFKDGTFSTSVDSCPSTDALTMPNGDAGTSVTFPTDLDPLALMNANTHYLCSDLLSVSTSSHRLQILQNDIPYAIGVASVDQHGNARLAFPSPLYTRPIPTLDFYHEYRNGDPQGQAVGGCSYAGSGSDLETLSSLAGLFMVIGVLRKRRPGRRS